MSPHPQVSVGETEQKHIPRSSYDAGQIIANGSVVLIPSTIMGNENKHDFWEEKLPTKISQSTPGLCRFYTTPGVSSRLHVLPSDCSPETMLGLHYTRSISSYLCRRAPLKATFLFFRYQRASSAGTSQAFHTYVYIHYFTRKGCLSIASYTHSGGVQCKYSRHRPQNIVF